MVVHKKQTVASGGKTKDKADNIDPIFTAEKKSPKKPAKKAKVSTKKKQEEQIKAFASQTALQKQLEKEQGFDSIIKSHLNVLENSAICKGMRTEKIAFAVFLALPEHIRGSQGFFSKQWGIGEGTLSAWKNDGDIQKVRMKVMKAVLLDKTPAVLDNLFNAASTGGWGGRGNTSAIKLWLQFVEEWEEASKVSLAADGFVINFHAGKSQFINPTDPTPAE